MKISRIGLRCWPTTLLFSGGALVPLAPAVVCAIAEDPSREEITVFPTGFDKIDIRDPKGDIDGRPANAAAADGMLWVSPGDVLNIFVQVPPELSGKQGTYQFHYKIDEEYEENCQKHIRPHPRVRLRTFQTPLEFGRDVKIRLTLDSLAAPGKERIVRELKAGQNAPILVPMGSAVRIEFHLPEDRVVFEPRGELTAGEFQKHVQPEIDQVRRNPKVRVSQNPLTDVKVLPGNLDQLEVRIQGARKKL